MPRISVVIIRTALLQLALGATIGGLLLADKGLYFAPWLWALRPGHVQMMLVGWVVQLACGVAIWILPRRDAHDHRGNLALAWLGYGALNGGVGLALLHPPLVAALGRARLAWMPPLAGLFYCVAVAAMVAHLWPRVRPFGGPARAAPQPTARS